MHVPVPCTPVPVPVRSTSNLFPMVAAASRSPVRRCWASKPGITLFMLHAFMLMLSCWPVNRAALHHIVCTVHVDDVFRVGFIHFTGEWLDRLGSTSDAPLGGFPHFWYSFCGVIGL